MPIFEKRSFDFSNMVASVVGGLVSTVDVVLCPAICVLDAYRVRLSVRVHAINIPGTDQNLRFHVDNILPSEEDPTQDFLGGGFLTLSLTGSISAPSLVYASSTDPEAYLRIILRATQGFSSNTLTATLSAALVLRPF